mmetsp:Transcript_8244/g.18600  ORF Transcript_8244/g.18600 Transcript_8244/m.18600 type:complete len:340 (+) Transcript_8244:224-1243(+)
MRRKSPHESVALCVSCPANNNVVASSSNPLGNLSPSTSTERSRRCASPRRNIPSGESSFATRSAKLESKRVARMLRASKRPTGVKPYNKSLKIQILRARAGIKCRNVVAAARYSASHAIRSCPISSHASSRDFPVRYPKVTRNAKRCNAGNIKTSMPSFVTSFSALFNSSTMRFDSSTARSRSDANPTTASARKTSARLRSQSPPSAVNIPVPENASNAWYNGALVVVPRNTSLANFASPMCTNGHVPTTAPNARRPSPSPRVVFANLPSTRASSERADFWYTVHNIFGLQGTAPTPARASVARAWHTRAKADTRATTSSASASDTGASAWTTSTATEA